MTPEERDALLRQYETKQEDISPEDWARTEESRRHMEEKIARGEVLKSWSKDNFPIGLDRNLEPFPLSSPDQNQQDDHDEGTDRGQ